MTITIVTSELVFDIRKKSEHECASLPVEQRYLFQAGSEKTDEINRCVLEALSGLLDSFARFLVRDESPADAMVASADLPQSIVLNLAPGARRYSGKPKAIANACVAYLADEALTRFYTTVGAKELAAARAALVAMDIKSLEALFYRKTPPGNVVVTP